VVRGVHYGAVALLVLGNSLGAQDLASRISAVSDGTVRMSFTTKPGVCGDGNSVSIGKRDYRSDPSWCQPGPARIEITLAGGMVTRARLEVGGHWDGSDRSTDLGRVPAAEAARVMLRLARDASGRGDDLVMAGVIADSSAPAVGLLRLAESAISAKIRSTAIFWLSAEAGESVMRQAGYPDETEQDEIASAAVFALSQRDEAGAVAALTRVVRSNASAPVKQNALFWLGQNGSPEAVGVIAEVLGL